MKLEPTHPNATDSVAGLLGLYAKGDGEDRYLEALRQIISSNRQLKNENEVLSQLEIPALRNKLKAAECYEAMCHCGMPMSGHGYENGHGPVAMSEPCPNEERVIQIAQAHIQTVCEILTRVAEVMQPAIIAHDARSLEEILLEASGMGTQIHWGEEGFAPTTETQYRFPFKIGIE